MKCPQCGSERVHLYDGALGYEGIRCDACGIETDAHDTSNYGPRTDPAYLTAQSDEQEKRP